MIRASVALGCGAVLLIVGASAHASFTEVGSPWPGQGGHEQILEGLYGGAFAALGLDFSNGTISAIRLPDYPRRGAQAAGAPLGQAGDQLWKDGLFRADAQARYTTRTGQSFGYFPGPTGGQFIRLFDVTGSGADAAGAAAAMIDLRGSVWRWGYQRDDPVQGQAAYSSTRAGAGLGPDNLVTYQITGLSDQGRWNTWLLFWEDKLTRDTQDDLIGDYNDLVVEVKASPVPAPGAILLGAVGLGVIGYFQRRRLP